MKKIICTFFIASSVLALSAQQTRAITDPQSNLKQAIEYYQKEYYSLAYPLFKDLNLSLRETDRSNQALNYQEIKYYTIVCGLKQNEAAAMDAAREYIDLDDNAARVEMINHGYDKLVHFSDQSRNFMNFLGLGGTVSLGLVVFAEFFCSIFLIIGLFSRFVVIPLIIEMCVLIFITYKGDVFGDGEHPALFLAGFLTLLLCGPGKASVDGMVR